MNFKKTFCSFLNIYKGHIFIQLPFKYELGEISISRNMYVFIWVVRTSTISFIGRQYYPVLT